ncbi:RNA polymerase sigma factor [Lutibacter sp. A64]|uniref:RNA polymerase sigma factor n=1 Tax=Lutibacter sp. A64 TaxID=2918526 RepID=UPI001F0579FB|nr:RNA polymerase sigma factor [Lutibacter sp. A64]UMB54625.1 RNA polymerase sigma factor [Lutibacter sp. A64]
MTDEELVSGIIDGNKLYFKILVDKYQSLVLNTCFHFTHNKNDAEDITQEVFIKVYESIKNFNYQSKLSTWLYRIAVNKSLNFIRDNKKRNIFNSIDNIFNKNTKYEQQIEEPTSIEEESDSIKIKRLNILRESIQLLPENQKIAFILHKYEEISYQEIAEIMNVSLASVEGLIHRAKINVQKNILKKIK